MKKRLTVCVCLVAAAAARAAWNGMGVPGGTGGRDICDAANWEDSVIDGDFTTVSETNETVVLVMSGDLVRQDVTVLSTNLTFASTNMIELAHPGLTPGLIVFRVRGATVMIEAVDSANGTVTFSQPISASDGTIQFIRPAFNFNFGLRTGKVGGVRVRIASDAPGVPRVLSAQQRIMLSQKTAPRNEVRVSGDITVRFPNQEGSLNAEQGSFAGGASAPRLILDGPVELAGGPGLTANRGDLVLNGPVSGAGKFLRISSEPKILTLTHPGSTFSGYFGIYNMSAKDSVIRFTSIGNAGEPSALGAAGDIHLAGTTGTTVLEYLGDADSDSDRRFLLEGGWGVADLIAVNGDGTLTLTGAIRNELAPPAANTFRNIYLSGSGNGAFTGTAALTNVVNGANTAVFSVFKQGTGTWRIAGAGCRWESGLHVCGGKLELDYTDGDPLTDVVTNVLRSAALAFKGGPSGATEDRVATVRLRCPAAAGTDSTFNLNEIALDANGGEGFRLTVGDLAAETPNIMLGYTLLDLSGDAGNTLTVEALSGGVSTAQRGELMYGPYNTQSRFVLKTADGAYCFPTTNGLGQVVAPALTAFPVSGYGTGTRYLLDAPGTTAPSADVALASLTVDSAAGAVTLDAGTYAFAPSGNTKGVGMLCRGPNDVTLIGTAWRGGMGSFFNFLGEEATLRFDVGALPMYVTWGGTGFTEYGGTGLGGGDFCLCGGVFRLTTAQTLAFSRRLALLGGGVLELGADLNGAAAGDFSLACGLANGTVSLFGDAGFSAAGADRTVNLGGAGAALTWGAGGFLMHPENIDNGYALKLASSRADATLTFINPINLGGGKETVRRVVEVADGAAAVDAALAGAVTGNEDAALVKAGPGTLKVTAAQRYGALRVHGGTLLAADGCFAAGAAVPVLLKAGAALAGVSGGSNAFGTLTLAGDAALDVGDGSASLVFADSSGIDWHGARLTVRGKLQNGKVRFGAGAGGLSAEQLAGIVMEGDAGVRIDADGWLVRVPRGTMLSVR